jgi:signal transduction histidine kinase
VTFGTSASFVVIYALCRPDLFTHPMAHIPILYLLTVSAISVGIGHYVYRLEVESFADAARLESAAAVLEEQLRLGDAAPTHLRREIARQLHDDVAQLLTSARIQLDGWSQGHGSDGPAGRLAELLDELARRSRRMLHELREPPARGPLLAELQRLRAEYEALGLTVDLLVDDGALGVLPEPAQVDVLVASAREALTNAVRHGKASEATVSVHAEPLVLELMVMDNGGGRAEAVREGYGLLGIRERAEGLGGTAELGDYEEGLRLSVTLPRARVA